MIKRMLANLGVGGAQVETRLDAAAATPGETIHGQVEVRGGSVEQSIESLDIVLKTTYRRIIGNDAANSIYTMLRQRLGAGLLPAGTRQIFPFAVTLPLETPLTVGQQPVWLHTELAIAGAMDPTDDDALKVTPHPLTQPVFDALHALGFSLDSCRCQEYGLGNREFPFIQILELRPHRSVPWLLGAIELVLRIDPEELDISLDVDRESQGAGRWLDVLADPRLPYTRWRVAHTIGQESLTASLRAAIDRSLG